MGHPEVCKEHDAEVAEQRDCDPDSVKGHIDDILSFPREHHDDRKEQGDERDRRNLRDEDLLVPGV